MSTDFKLEENKIFSTVTGDLVATVEETGIRMQPGKNALTPKVKAFWETYSVTAAAPETQESSGAPEFEAQPAAADTSAAFQEEEEVNTHLLNDHQEGTFFFGGVPGKGGTSAPAREKLPEQKNELKSSKALAVWDIPEDQLPEFSPALGVSTPEFKAFIKKHKFAKEQVIELVKRLETLKYKKEN